MPRVDAEQREPKLRRFPPYPEYRPSEADWLDELPNHWEEKRLKYLAPPSDERASIFEADLPFVGLEHIESSTGKFLDSPAGETAESGGSVFRPGDVLFGKLRPYLAKVLRPSFEGRCSTEILVLRSAGELRPEFLYYQLLSEWFIGRIDAGTYGTKMPRADPHRVAYSLLVLPPRDEQQLIASFLDHETAKIDALIAEKERLVELLLEKRAALITRAVTKGLDPNAPMKDSGVEWLGEVPSHWKPKKFKYVTHRVDVGIAEAATHAYSDEGVPIIRSTNVGANHLDTRDVLRIQKWFADKNRSKYLRAGDLVTVRTGNPGITAIVPSELEGSQCFTLLLSTSHADQEESYLCYFLNSRAAQSYFEKEGRATAQTNISVPILQEITVPNPPQPEQKELVKHLDRWNSQLDELISRVSSGIKVLNELRTALISAAVTGKIDVREEAQ